jgi:hypothetical protein
MSGNKSTGSGPSGAHRALARAMRFQKIGLAKNNLVSSAFLFMGQETGFLPSCWHCHAGTLIYKTVFRFAIAI